MAATPGYSGKSLSDKLGLKPSMRVSVVRAPKGFASWLAPLPAGTQLLGGRVTQAGCAILFVSRKSELVHDLPGVLQRLAEGGMCWICWPKKSSKVATDVTETVLRELVLPAGWVDVKVCAVSDVWSGLKFLRRRPK